MESTTASPPALARPASKATPMRLLAIGLLAALVVSPWLGLGDHTPHLMVMALLIGCPCFRFKLVGHCFALVTLALSEVTRLSAVMTCIGGALVAQYQLYVNLETVSGIGISLQMVFGVIAGGMFVMLGPTVGAVFLLLLSEGLRVLIGNDIHGVDTSIYGLLLILFIIFMPKGILGAALARFGRP